MDPSLDHWISAYEDQAFFRIFYPGQMQGQMSWQCINGSDPE
jgi:hypothetical protein